MKAGEKNQLISENRSSLSVAERIDLAIVELRTRIPDLALFEQEPMDMHCSFKIGGPARALALPQSREEAIEICRVLDQYCLRPFILGNGSNVVFPDAGTERLFILSTERLQKVVLREDGSIEAEAGVSLARLAGFALEHGLSGLEFAAGIPGSVGGGVIMNAGAYGGELKDAIASVSSISLSTLEHKETLGADCAFGYRTSCFQISGDSLVLSAVFCLSPEDKENISAKVKEFNARRREKQPLDLPSAGSTFRRPEGYFAAALIDECGLKGTSIGGVQVSEKHAGFLVNTGGGTERDLRTLIETIKKTVWQKKGVLLETEVILISPMLSSAKNREEKQ